MHGWPLNCELPSMRQTLSSDPKLTRFEVILQARVAELERGVRQRDGIAIDPSPDQVDEIQRASERALAISKIDRDSKQLRDVRAALRSIREGTYGFCEQCEEEINPKRLVAIPWALLCIECQEALERDQVTLMSTDSPLGRAA